MKTITLVVNLIDDAARESWREVGVGQVHQFNSNAEMLENLRGQLHSKLDELIDNMIDSVAKGAGAK